MRPTKKDKHLEEGACKWAMGNGPKAQPPDATHPLMSVYLCSLPFTFLRILVGCLCFARLLACAFCFGHSLPWQHALSNTHKTVKWICPCVCVCVVVLVVGAGI